jgi:hypothetical protein
MLNIVGQAPGRTSDPDRPLEARNSRERLEHLLSVSLDECHVVNLLSKYPGPAAGKGDLFPLHRARRAARVIDLATAPVVLVGLRVAEAFGVEHPRHFQRCEVRGRPAIVVPHPSGVSTWWNDPRNVEAGRAEVLAWKTKWKTLLKKHTT